MRDLLPTRAQYVDLALLVALCTVALLGLADTFTGWSYAGVGVAGILLGTVVAHVTMALRWPVALSVLVVAALLFLLGPPLALRGAGAAVPGPGAFRTLADQLTGGWKDLLTTLPPVDGNGPLLVLPWALGLVAGWLGVLLARLPIRPRWLAAVLPLVVPAALLATVILLGVNHPASLGLQGAAFAGLGLAWLVVRTEPAVTVMDTSRRLMRGAGAAAMLVLAGVVALPLASMAGAEDEGRVHLRPHVEPPFDVGQYASPLSSFRRYVKMPRPDAMNLYDKTLLTVEGAPKGTRLRFAALDRYDGVVWGASDQAAGSDGFQRVSSTIDNPTEGREVEVTVTLGEGYQGVWLPTAGALQGFEFLTGDAEALSAAFRYNLATSTAVVPPGVDPGDRYRFRAVLPDDSLAPESVPGPLVGDVGTAGGFLDTQAVQWSAGQSEPMRRVFAVADHLKSEGKYSDGVLEAEKIYHAGHYVRRLSEEFANAPIMVGNDEQYAAVMALLANRIGVPARVVMGAVVPESGVVTGSDVQAWVELEVADGSWRTLPTEKFMDFDRPAEQPPQTEQQMTGTVVPPPAPIPPPSTVGEQTDAELKARKNRKDDDGDKGFTFPAWLRAVLLYVGGPLLFLLLLAGLVVGLKALRRHRRRTADGFSARIVGAWRELVDHARDLGHPVPTAGTRREQSTAITLATAPVLARTADQHVFGPAAPDEGLAASFWEEVDRARREMSAAVDRRRRALAAVNLRTFRRGR